MQIIDKIKNFSIKGAVGQLKLSVVVSSLKKHMSVGFFGNQLSRTCLQVREKSKVNIGLNMTSGYMYFWRGDWSKRLVKVTFKEGSRNRGKGISVSYPKHLSQVEVNPDITWVQVIQICKLIKLIGKSLQRVK